MCKPLMLNIKRESIVGKLWDPGIPALPHVNRATAAAVSSTPGLLTPRAKLLVINLTSTAGTRGISSQSRYLRNSRLTAQCTVMGRQNTTQTLTEQLHDHAVPRTNRPPITPRRNVIHKPNKTPPQCTRFLASNSTLGSRAVSIDGFVRLIDPSIVQLMYCFDLYLTNNNKALYITHAYKYESVKTDILRS